MIAHSYLTSPKNLGCCPDGPGTIKRPGVTKEYEKVVWNGMRLLFQNGVLGSGRKKGRERIKWRGASH